MKSYVSTALAAVLVLALPACQKQAANNDAAEGAAAAASLGALSGTWKIDLASLKFEGKPDEYLLKDGSFSCASCIPPYALAADGQMHPVADRDYWDSASVKVVDDKTVEFHRAKAGKEVSSMTQSVSADGKVMTVKFKDMTTPGQVIEGTGTLQRAGPAPAGSHAVSGQWKQDKVGEYSEDAQSLTYKVDGKTVTFSGQGQSYTAELGGPEVAIQGDTGGTMVKVAAEGTGSLKESFTRKGKETGYTVITPSGDGKSISFTYTDTQDGTSTSWTGNKTS
jgi:hypothetical protein